MDGLPLSGASVTAVRSAEPHERHSAASQRDGRYSLPNLEAGTYIVTITIDGYRTASIGSLDAVAGRVANGDAVLMRWATSGQTWDRAALDRLPVATDPWSVATLSPAAVMTLGGNAAVNVGGASSGQQLEPNTRGAGLADVTWRLDGAGITDLGSIGSSPLYFDFDTFKTIAVTTAAADIATSTAGVSFLLTTPSGTDRVGGSARAWWSGRHLQSSNVSQALFDQGAGAGVPLEHFHDVGLNGGGPIVRKRLWWWAGYGQEHISSTALNFNQTTAACTSSAPSFTALSVAEDCLYPIVTHLNFLSARVSARVGVNQTLSARVTGTRKTRDARDASALTAPESTRRQSSDSPDANIGHDWQVGDRLAMTSTAAWVDNRFDLDFITPSLASVQPVLNLNTGAYSRSLPFADYIKRPELSLATTGTWLIGQTHDLAHSLIFGGGYRHTGYEDYTTTGGGVVVRYRNGQPDSAVAYRDGLDKTLLLSSQGFLQYQLSGRRLTLAAGARIDHQDDSAPAASIPAHPVVPSTLGAGNFTGSDPLVNFTDAGPRVSASVDVFGTGRTIVSGAYNWYFGQGMRLALLDSLTRTAQVTFAWTDPNHDGVFQANEAGRVLSSSSRFNTVTGLFDPLPDRVDPALLNRRVREWLFRADHEFSAGWRVGAAYISRVYDRFSADGAFGETMSDFVARQWTDPLSGASATYYEFPPGHSRSSFLQTANQAGRTADYRGIEVSGSAALSRRWNASVSFTRQSTTAHWPAGSYGDPTNIDKLDGFAADTNTPRFILRAMATALLPMNARLSASLNVQDGPVRTIVIDSPARIGIGTTTPLMLAPQGTDRYPTLAMLDLRADKDWTFGRRRLILSIVAFNLLNADTVLSRSSDRSRVEFDKITTMVGPRVLRLGAALHF